ncbi:MAG: ABC transporter permease subunit [Mycoplasmoidaceae bacterium]
MLKYIAKRILYVLLTLFVLVTLLFFLMQLIPGYPIQQGIQESNEAFNNRLSQLGLTDPALVQYFNFWGKLFSTGEFGIIFENAGNVSERFLEPVKYTLLFAIPSFIISAILGVFFGTIAAFYRGKWQDITISIFSVIFIAIPSFVFALYLIQFAGAIGLPTNIVVPGADGYTLEKMILSLIIPITSVVLSSVSATVYFTRNELVEVFKQEYIKTALSKGMNFRVVVFKHALRNAAIPILYSLLPSLLMILSGSIIIERFFNVPGTASLVISAVNTNEYYIVMFSAVFYSGIYFLIQIFFDAMSTVIDPRIKLVEKSPASWYEQIKSKLLRKKDVVYNVQSNVVDAKSAAAKKEVVKETKANFNLSFEKPKVLNKDLQTYDKALFKRVDLESVEREEILGKPSNQLVDIFKRFISNKAAIVFSIVFIIILLLAIFYPIFGPAAGAPINNELKDVINFLPPRVPFLGITGIIYDQIMTLEKYELWASVPNAIIGNPLFIGDGLVQVTYNPYALPELQGYFPLFGTGPQGVDWLHLLWVSTSNSIFMALTVSVISTVIGSIYGAIAGYNAGKPLDTFMMRVVELVSGVPTIVWILVITLVFSGGSLSLLTIGGALIFTSWIWSAQTARIFVLKYKDAEFIQASKTLGASKTRLIFTHLLPNISGKIMVRFVNQIPLLIFFETSLVFLGLKAPTEASLGSMIEIARQTGYFHLLFAPTSIIVLITLSAQIIANAFNDSLDPRVIGR